MTGMDCVDIKEAVLRGESLSWEAAQHVAGCPVCSLALSEQQTTGSDESLFTDIRRAIDEERGVRAWLRSRSTNVRLTLGAGWALALVALVALLTPRTHYAPMPFAAVVVVLAVLSALGAVVLRLELHPLQAPEPSIGVVAACFAAVLVAPAVLAFAPVPQAALFDHYTEFSPPQAAFGCFFIGVMTGVLVVAGLRALDRRTSHSRTGVLVQAAAGGVAGNLALELHCPITRPSHIVFAHATVSLVLLALYEFLPRRRPA
ncbi:MAG TPA: hypothetical protein VH142_09615 [Polyangiaceae bacterium]|jgi:hypothetical protein|nr:hypothetical protein [Polyangiaceae bacterium]